MHKHVEPSRLLQEFSQSLALGRDISESRIPSGTCEIKAHRDTRKTDGECECVNGKEELPRQPLYHDGQKPLVYDYRWMMWRSEATRCTTMKDDGSLGAIDTITPTETTRLRRKPRRLRMKITNPSGKEKNQLKARLNLSFKIKDW
ncbi:unnamed protein product [Choristocarpus tenellus]